MSFYSSYGLNRTMCDVLNELRKCYETRNFANMLSLVEEVQSMGNRMEAALYDIKDLKSLHKDIKKAKKELKALEAKNESS
jgi:hypothetical protein